MDENNQRKSPPRDDLVRGGLRIELRDGAGGGDGKTLYGHFSVANQWTVIDSVREGRFLERIAPGAFKKTLKENPNPKVLFQHGQDPQIGSKPIASLRAIGEDEVGAYYEAELFTDASYVRDLMPAIRAEALGASFMFNVLREDKNDNPGVSDYNPEGLTERTIREVQLFELGPVTWGAYDQATAGIRSEMRSLTDEFVAARTGTHVQALTPDEGDEPSTTTTTGDLTDVTFTVTGAEDARTVNADETEETATTAAPPHPAEEDRAVAPSPPKPEPKEEEMDGIEEMRARAADMKAELDQIASEHIGSMLDSPTQTRWDQLVADREDLKKRIKATEDREEYLRSQAAEGIVDEPDGQTRSNPGNGRPLSADTGTYVTRTAGRSELPDNVFDVGAYHSRARSQEHMTSLMRDGAMRAMEGMNYTGAPHLDRATVNTHIEKLIGEIPQEMSQRILTHGSPTYRSAYWKTMLKQPLSREEQSAMSNGMALERALTTGDTGGVTVPVQIDPTVLPSSNGALNPFRQISRVVTTTSHQWQAVTAADVTANYRAQAATMTDNSPTLVAPAIQPERCDIMFPFAWEAAQDWSGLERDLGMLIQRAKDNAEAAKFAVGAGHGSNEPLGVLTGAGTLVGTMATVSIGTADIFNLFNQLGPSFQGNATWVASQTVLARFRSLATATGPGMWAPSLVPGYPDTLAGRPIYAASSVGTAGGASTPVASVKYAVIGDFSYFAIVDRVGLQTKFIENLFAGNTAGGIAYPTGQSGLVAYWRNSSGVLASNAFRTGTVT